MFYIIIIVIIQAVELAGHLLAGLVGVDLDVVVHAVGGPDAHDARALQDVVLDDPREHLLG